MTYSKLSNQVSLCSYDPKNKSKTEKQGLLKVSSPFFNCGMCGVSFSLWLIDHFCLGSNISTLFMYEWHISREFTTLKNIFGEERQKKINT